MRSKTFLLVIAAGLALGGCGDEGPPAGCDRFVSPGGDDQTNVQLMFEEAQDEETLCFRAGTYSFTDPIAISRHTGVTIRGAGATRDDVVLDFQTQTAGEKGLNVTSMDDVLIENLTILDATGDNLFVTGSDGVTIRNVRSGWVTRPIEARGKYAIYPVQSTNVLVEDSEAFGSSDAGIYVGQTTNCLVRRNVAVGNVAGIEIENSSNCEVVDNEAYENTGGILVFELPGLPMRGGSTLIHDNIVRDNNVPNFAPGGVVELLPAGTGMMVLAANQVEIRDNQITGNESTGILVASYTAAVFLGEPMPTDPDYDLYIDDLWIHGNTFTENGTAPHEPLFQIAVVGGATTLEDVVWDGELAEGASATDFCFEGEGTFRDGNLASMFMTQSTDRAPYMCTGAAVPGVTL
ncbi:MAG: right-handed parallel beta-helix repeat-containing protein [Myxococcota bacterium]|nr:right-handed parallel beta-helix repeat-containing protein [Myxococcota bacterium]